MCTVHHVFPAGGGKHAARRSPTTSTLVPSDSTRFSTPRLPPSLAVGQLNRIATEIRTSPSKQNNTTSQTRRKLRASDAYQTTPQYPIQITRRSEKKRPNTDAMADLADQHTHHPTTQQPSAPSPSSETLSPLEQEVLDEYARLLGNLNNVRLLALNFPYNLSAIAHWRLSIDVDHPL